MAKKEQGDKDTPVGALWLWSCNKISLVAMSLCVCLYFLAPLCSFGWFVALVGGYPFVSCILRFFGRILHACCINAVACRQRNLRGARRYLQFTMAQQEERKLISVVANCKCNLLKSFPDGRH